MNNLLQPFRSCFSRQATFEWFVVIVVGFMLRSDHLGVTSRKLHQESENVSKGDYIFGHLFGAIGILVGDSRKWFCLPLFMNLQDGVKTILGWKKSASEPESSSHVVQMIEQGFEAAKGFGQALLLLDRYFLSVPALERLNACHLASETRMHLVTKAKSNAVAYERPPAKKPGRGRPPKKGHEIKLKELFTTRAADFQTATILLYDQEETIQYLCLDLLWGQGLYQELRFVLVVHQGRYSILVSTDLSLAATDIIRLYSYRFKIECTFREMKQVTHAFGYRFWSKSMPKLKRFLKKEEAHPLEVVTNEQDRQRIEKTIQAIEGFVMCQCIAMGLLQLVALQFSGRTSGLVFPLSANALPCGGLGGQRCCLFTQIYFSPVCSESACIHNENN
ncbi:transposase [Paenibacillus terrae]|uniref:transposase n=1 Tax=Paenibacillus terrae TaxID=159743 RepID=UPI00207B7342|nr:transposase [Paenibacillus terrae]